MYTAQPFTGTDAVFGDFSLPSPEEQQALEDQHNLQVIRSIEKRRKLIENMHRFVRRIKATDFVGLSGQGEKIQYTHKHKSMKFKGGTPPKDYTAVEIFVDLQYAIKEALYDDALPLYFTLKRWLRWSDD